jgi:hypothetical protein
MFDIIALGALKGAPLEILLVGREMPASVISVRQRGHGGLTMGRGQLSFKSFGMVTSRGGEKEERARL